MDDEWFNTVFDLMAQIVITVYSKEKGNGYHIALTDSIDTDENSCEL